MILPHDLLVLTGVNAVVYDFSEVQRGPTGNHDGEHLEQEWPGDVTRVEVVFEQGDRHEVNYESEDRTYDHFVVYFVDLREHIQDFTNNEGAESNGDNVCEGLLFEYNDGAEHNDAGLENGLPHPNQESLCGKNSSFLKSGVENGELHDCSCGAVFVSNQGEHREVSVNGRVAHHQEPVVDRNGHEVESN